MAVARLGNVFYLNSFYSINKQLMLHDICYFIQDTKDENVDAFMQ